MKHLSLEEVWKRYPNKYQGLNVASLEARHIIEALQKGDIQLSRNLYEMAFERMVSGELKFDKLTEAEMEALTREGYAEPSFGRMV